MIKNKAVKILLYGGTIWCFGEGMLGPLFAVFAQRLGGDILDISWAFATYLIVSGVLFVIVGKYADMYKNKELLMVFGYALNTIFTFGYILVSNPWHLFIVQVGLGIATAMATPTWDALYARHEDRRHDVFQWGLAGGMAKIVTGLALIIGGYIVSVFSFTALFMVMGFVQLIATIYQAQIFRIKHSENVPPKEKQDLSSNLTHTTLTEIN